MTKSTQSLLKTLKSLKIQNSPPIPDILNHKKWLPYQILGYKTIKNVQIGDMVDKANRDVVRE